MPLEMSPHAAGLTLLLVEDNEYCRELATSHLSRHFKRVVMARDGGEGLAQFHAAAPDIVVTDHNMPGLTGLELTNQIRCSNRKTPVVLMTGNLDERMLVEAINLEIAKFIPKPFRFELLFQALNDVVIRLADEQLLERHRRQEVELLRYRDRYNSMQQQAALRKEHHVVRHDLRHRLLASPDGVRWGVEVVHSARDIMCGDGFTVRHLPDGRVLIFLIDSMGSGLSASLTTLLATSFCNFLVQHLYRGCGLTFQRLLDLFMEYASGVLLDDEAISCGFFLIDLGRSDCETALFGLPPFLVRTPAGTVRAVRSANAPLCRYTEEVASTRLNMKNVADLLLVTDGVPDAEVAPAGCYRTYLRRDFQASPTLASLQRKFLRRVCPQEEGDDRTVLRLHRIDLTACWSWSCRPEPSLSGLEAAGRAALLELAEVVALKEPERDELELVLNEALMNAFEHGCLRLAGEEKRRAILAGEYEELLARAAPLQGCGIELTLSLWQGTKEPLLKVEVRDSGGGFSEDFFRRPAADAVTGRGLRLIRNHCDSFYAGGPGGTLVILKALEGEHSWKSNVTAAP